MRARILICLVSMAFAFQSSWAQPYTIRGSIYDTLNNNPLQYASISLLRAKDSVLQNFTRSKDNGSFTLTTSSNDKYLVMITFPGFADYVEQIEIAGKNLDMDTVPLISRTHLLKEFVLTQQYAAIKVKGDTIEYVADSFKLKDNATVEALLKKLPGLQVDKKGQITAHGQKVEKLLVDGEEFFSDDPAVVTRGLQADAVDKVQVFDKKSEQAEFTGIDDGEKTRTINLQLKEDKKKGYFGKLSAGGGAGADRSYFENQAMLNAFKGKKQFSAFGIISNTDNVGLGWEDRNKYNANSGNTEMSDDGGYITYYTSDDDNIADWDGSYTGQGLPKVWTGGVHYADKWKEDKHHVSGNYRYAKHDMEVAGNTTTQYILPDSQFHTTQDRNIYNSKERHGGDGMYEWKMDSTSNLKFKVDGSYSTTRSNSQYKAKTYTGSGVLANSSERTINSIAEIKSINSSLDWRKKLKKQGRTISLNLTEKHRETETNGFLKSLNTYTSSVEMIDQHKESDNNTTSLSSKIVYTEPLSKIATLELNYSIKVDDASALRFSYNKTNPTSDVYDSLDTRFSSDYTFNTTTNRGGSTLRFNLKKMTLSASGAVANIGYTQKDIMADTSFRYSFTNFFPSALFKYTISQQSSLRLSYNGATNQPTLEQIQPLRDNTDPLNVAIGNPSLIQEFSHTLNLNYHDFRRLSGRYIWLNIGGNTVSNDISRSENIDASGKRTYQYINVNGNRNLWYYIGYGFKFGGLQIGGRINGNLNHMNNVVNGNANTSNNNSYTMGLEISYDSDDEKFNVNFEPKATYNISTSTINTLNTTYWSGGIEFDTYYRFPKKIELGTDIDWSLRQQTPIFTQNNNVFIWNAYVSKKFMKSERLELNLSINDILNQNLGFNRNAQNNYITQDSYNTIRRYGLLKLTWNFTKTPMDGTESTTKD